MQRSVRGVKTRLYSRTNNDVVGLWDTKFSPSIERLCWVALVTLHIICSAYYVTITWCYWHLSGTLLDNWLSFYRLGLGSKHYNTVAIVHGCFAGVHFSYLVWMIGWSIKKQRLVLAVYKVSKQKDQLNLSVLDRCRAAFSKLGVNGPYFDVVLLFREIVETALQTNQAYRMSLLLSRLSLNRGYVVLLVLNCWSTVFVHHFFHANTARRRLWALICDCVLDLVTAVGITSVLLVIYWSEFIIEQEGFASYKWYEDVWIVNVMSEYQILMVSSWGDFAMRVVFALSMVTNMNNMKGLLSAKRVCSSKTLLEISNSRTSHGIAAIVPLSPTLTDVQSARKQSTSKTSIKQAMARAESSFVQILFFAWGAFILILHLYAEFTPTFSQCMMQLKPWFSSQPSCSFLMLNCYKSRFNGIEDEVYAQWSPFDPTNIVSVVIRHCPSLEMPSKLTEFSGLRVLKVYNSTISRWPRNAGISQKHHPNLLMLFLIRVNMVNGELPAGMYRNNMPRSLIDIELCVTNLCALPDDLELTYPSFATIYIEASNLTEIPPSLAKLNTYDLSLALNPISSIPASLIEGNAGYLHVGGTLISELPEIVNDVSPYFKIRVDNTNVSFFWDWMDPMMINADGGLVDGIPTILASNTPYCSDLQRIYNGEQTSFSPLLQPAQSLLLSNASVGNWAMLQKTVACNEWPKTYYPIDSEDEYSGIKTD